MTTKSEAIATQQVIDRGVAAAERWSQGKPCASNDPRAAYAAVLELVGPESPWRASQPASQPGEEEPTGTLGVISEGTNETAELIPRFYSALEDIDEESALEWRVEYPYTAGWDSAGAAPDMMPPGEESVDAFNDLFARLNHRAPIFCYFGVHRERGRGSDYGFFPDFNAIEEASNDGDLLKTDAGSSGQPGYILEVNDHGNVTLYALTKEEVWNCV